MIYDCFTFFNELDLLEIRLNTLKSVVDKFVLVEATRTQNNEEKKLYYQENKERFEEFSDKIIHIVLDEYPQKINKWTIENLQRNKIKDALTSCQDNDIIMISDLDEIPNPDIVMKIKDNSGIKALDMRIFFYFLNREAKNLLWNHATKILFYKDFKNILDDDDVKSEALDNQLNEKTTASKIRLYYGDKQVHYPNAGWHFSWLGNANHVRNKAKAVCEGDVNFDIKQAENMIINDKSWNGLTTVKIDDSFPKYIVKNKNKFKKYIAHSFQWQLGKLFQIKTTFSEMLKGSKYIYIYMLGVKIKFKKLR